MSLKQRLQDDFKVAMQARDRFSTEVLSALKSAVLYEEVAKNKREEGLSDPEIEQVLAREAKKRTESAELFDQGGNREAAEKERREKAIIDTYLPKQMSDEELTVLIKKVIAELGDTTQMGQVIGAVKAKAGTSADGGRIASIVKQELS